MCSDSSDRAKERFQLSDTAGMTRRDLRHLGIDVRLTPGILMADAVALAKEIYQQIPGAFLVDQFSNPANITVHRRTTAEEIWSDTVAI